MENLDIVTIIRCFEIGIYMFFTFLKITNKKMPPIKYIGVIIILNICISIMYGVLHLITKTSVIIYYIMICFFYFILLKHLTKERTKQCIATTVISFLLTYCIYLLSVTITAVLIHIFKLDHKYHDFITLINVPVIMCLIIYLVFRIKRFKSGFNFLKVKRNYDNMITYLFIFLESILLFSLLYKSASSPEISMYLYLVFLATAIIFIIWIRLRITKQYRENMQTRTIDLQQEELKEKDSTIELLKDENMKLSETIHKYNNRFDALQSAVLKTINMSNKNETSKELSVLLDEINKMSESFSNEIINSTNVKGVELPKTNIHEIDSIFEHMAEIAKKDSIRFDIEINSSINNLIENVISKDDFCTLIGDHIKDAIIAINSNNGEKKQIMAVLGIINGCYELSIFDTGIEFEINTLLKLGEERITTHKDSGGSGIGFMTTFKTLNKCGGSICIEEYKDDYYTKQIIFRFDGLKQYRIHSYRSEEIKSLDKKQRIIFY